MQGGGRDCFYDVVRLVLVLESNGPSNYVDTVEGNMLEEFT